MSASRDSAHDEQQLLRYLLGVLPAEETERLDEMSIVDGDMTARLAAVEEDLIDAYVRGQLSGETLQQFERRYLMSARRRQKVRFAESLIRAIEGDRSAEPDADAATPPRRWFSRKAGIWSLAVAAALLFVASGGLLMRESQLRERLSEAQRQGTALDRRTQELEEQLGKERDAHAAAANELERVRGMSPDMTGRPPVTGTPPAPTRRPPTVALVLLPQTRSGGPVPTIALPPGAEAVALELQLEMNDFSRYEATLQEPATNRTVWRSGRLPASTVGDQFIVPVGVPSRLLGSQHYALVLQGYDETNAAQVVSSYTFRIVRR